MSSGNVHVHPLFLPTTVDERHLHYLRAYTEPAPGGLDDHVHRYYGVTTYNFGHVHRYWGVTGPAKPLPGGGHYHLLQGETSVDEGHKHSYKGRTGRNIRR